MNILVTGTNGQSGNEIRQLEDNYGQHAFSIQTVANLA